MVRKEPWEALKEYFYKKVFPKPQEKYKQQISDDFIMYLPI